MVEQEKKLVVITGATGYLGSTILKLFIEKDKYRIRATVRDNNKDKLDKMRNNMKVSKEQWEKIDIVIADLTDEKSIGRAV